MEIVQERLEREFDQDLITTAPTVVYQVVMRDGSIVQVENPAKLPDVRRLKRYASRSSRQDFRAAGLPGQRHHAVQPEARQSQVDMHYHGRQVKLTYEMPMAEVVMDFFDKLKSVLQGLRLARLRLQGISLCRRRQARHPDQ
jgi:GTP-binding protein LepA